MDHQRRFESDPATSVASIATGLVRHGTDATDQEDMSAEPIKG
jgi:hypothetical protein